MAAKEMSNLLDSAACVGEDAITDQEPWSN